MRRIKKAGEFHTLESASRLAETDNLCGLCSFVGCSVREIQDRLKTNKYDAQLEVLRCKSFVTQIQFRDTGGLDDRFNTFRAGAAWVDRVATGDKVALMKSEKLIGFARVVKTHSGRFVDLNAKFGEHNHLSIDARSKGKKFDLGAEMIRCYGSGRFTLESSVSVIELEREDGGDTEGG